MLHVRVETKPGEFNMITKQKNKTREEMNMKYGEEGGKSEEKSS